MVLIRLRPRADQLVAEINSAGERLDKMKYRELEAEYVKYVLSDEFHFEHRALYEKVQTKGYGICPRCEYRYGCSQCDPEKAFSFSLGRPCGAR